MKRPTKTYYKYAPPKDAEGPARLVKLDASVWGTGLKFVRSSSDTGFSSLDSNPEFNGWFPSPNEALAHYKKRLHHTLEAAEAKAANARESLESCPEYLVEGHAVDAAR